MNRIIVAFLIFISYLLASSKVFAESCNQSQILTEAYKAAKKHIETISCESILSPKNLVPLTPWRNCDNNDERHEAKYALFWSGDIGCEGGSGSPKTRITIIRIGMGSTPLVDTALSSPVVKFDFQAHVVKRILKTKPNEILLEALDWGPDDPLCCASVPVRILLRQDKNGGWTQAYKRKIVPAKK